MVTVRSIYDHLEIDLPDSARTLDGFRAWARSDSFPDRGRLSFIEGEIHVDTSPEKLDTHTKVKGEIGRVVAGLARDLDRGEYYPDRTLVTNVEAGVSNEPDGTFVSWETWETGKARLVPVEGEEDSLEIEGTPDWVLEVVSNSSVRKDTQLLRKAYHRAGIREYWLVDARGADIVFKVLIHRPRGYVAARTADGWQWSEVFQKEFRLERRRGRLGRWQYTLHYRPA